MRVIVNGLPGKMASEVAKQVLRTKGLELAHNVNGRDVYVAGTIDAIKYLGGKIAAGERGKVYSMIDVLKSK